MGGAVQIDAGGADHYLLTVYRYIELNPVRAGMVAHASEYPWSSYQSNALGNPIQLLTPYALYHQLGKNASERKRAYRALFRGRMAERDLAAIREATNKAWVLGDDRFKVQSKPKLGVDQRLWCEEGIESRERLEKVGINDSDPIDQLVI